MTLRAAEWDSNQRSPKVDAIRTSQFFRFAKPSSRYIQEKTTEIIINIHKSNLVTIVIHYHYTIIIIYDHHS